MTAANMTGNNSVHLRSILIYSRCIVKTKRESYLIRIRPDRRRNGFVIIAMEAMDQLLVACHAQTLNLFVESFLKMVQKLLESTDPQLQILATQSVSGDHWMDYSRRFYLIDVSTFSSSDLLISRKTRPPITLVTTSSCRNIRQCATPIMMIQLHASKLGLPEFKDCRFDILLSIIKWIIVHIEICIYIYSNISL